MPAAPAARAASSSPCGKNIRLLPTGARMNGRSNVAPITVVLISHVGVGTAQRGRNVRSSNARALPRSVTSSSAPPSM